MGAGWGEREESSPSPDLRDLSGSKFKFRSADGIASSYDDTASQVTSHLVTSIENLYCLSVNFVLLLNTKFTMSTPARRRLMRDFKR